MERGLGAQYSDHTHPVNLFLNLNLIIPVKDVDWDFFSRDFFFDSLNSLKGQ